MTTIAVALPPSPAPAGACRSRMVRISMPVPAQRSATTEVIAALGGILGGGFGARVIAAWTARKKLDVEKQSAEKTQAVELTARVFEEGDDLRALLLAEAQAARTELRQVLDRAHAAEVQVAVQRAELERLQKRLERKDVEMKALMNQVITAGLQPVILSGPGGRAPELAG